MRVVDRLTVDTDFSRRRSETFQLIYLKKKSHRGTSNKPYPEGVMEHEHLAKQMDATPARISVHIVAYSSVEPVGVKVS